jgi:fructokinase
LILSIGEILFDLFPRGRRLGGAPFNFAFHVNRLGGSVRFLSRIGDDAEGRAILAFLEDQQFPSGDLQVDRENPTGRVDVTLDAAGSPRFDILPDMAYDALVATPAIERFVSEDCRLIYFGSLIQRTPRGARTVRRILERRPPGTKCLFDVNLRPGCFSAAQLRDSLQDADFLKLNEEELATLAGMNAIGGPAEDQVAALRERFAIEKVALTRGPQGSSLFDGHARHDAAPPADVVVKDTVGAGDAFAAVLALGILARWPAARTLAAANRLAAAICGIAGAVPADPSFYDPLREMLIEGRDHG